MKDYKDFDVEKAKSEFTEDRARDEFKRRSSDFSKTDIEEIMENQEKISEKFHTGALKKFSESFGLLIGVIKDYMSGAYREIPWVSIAGIGATLLYVFSPIDFIPDFIPVAGLVDDAGVVAVCLAAISADLQIYKDWKDSQG